MRLIGVDVGGTFTDAVFADTRTGRRAVHKLPTSADDPSLGVLTAVLELCRAESVAPDSIDLVYHGTTIATNALLEYKGARTGLVTTQGYRDILHIGRHQRPHHYSIQQEIPWQDRPLVRRRYRKVVPERLIPPHGEVLVPLDEAAVRRAARELRHAGVEAIAVCFLFSYLNPAHEHRARDIILEEYPDVFVTTSAALSPQFREFERFTTTAINAFIGPKVHGYVSRLEARLRDAGLRAELRIIRSNGGLAPPQVVAQRPALTLLSGPAAGVLGGAWTGQGSERRRLITFDVGGTSADIGVVTDGQFSEASARDTWIAGYPLLVPMIDIHTIGAGGGSIAHVDAGGGFRVGPHSAGSQPGPAAYGRGGSQPTVTDAHILLGRLDEHNFLGGAMALDHDAARSAIADLAGQLGLSELETAEGIVTILNSNMANAIRSRTVQKGIDPRAYSLVAFGGAGPLHGAEVARMLGIPECIIPAYPGITSAVGLLTTDVKYDAMRTAFQVSTAFDTARLHDAFDAMRAELSGQFTDAGTDPEHVGFERFADVRYVGQGYELRIPVPDGRLNAPALDTVVQRFHRRHESEYGHFFTDSPIEIVTVRLVGIGRAPKIDSLSHARPDTPEPTGAGSLQRALLKTQPSVFRVNHALRRLDTAFYRREDLPVDDPVAGPAVIVQTDSTTLIPPDCRCRLDPRSNLIIEIGGVT